MDLGEGQLRGGALEHGEPQHLDEVMMEGVERQELGLAAQPLEGTMDGNLNMGVQ